MKKIQMPKNGALVVGGTGGINRPTIEVEDERPIGAPSTGAFVEAAPRTIAPSAETYRDPPPAQVVIPGDFDGLFKLAQRAGQGAMVDKAQLWAMLAQADATNRQVEATNRMTILLEELIEFVGARDSEDEEPNGPRLCEAIADGLVMAAEHAVREKSQRKQ